MDPKTSVTTPTEIAPPTYEDAGYNKYLTRYVVDKTFYSALDFDSMVEDEGISTSSVLMQIKDGKIVVEDKDGNNILDNFGVVSTNTFQFGTVTGSGSQATSNVTPTYSYITGLRLQLTLERQARVLFMVDVQGVTTGQWDDANHGECWILLYLDNTTVLGSVLEVMGFRFGDPSSSWHGQAASSHTIQTLDAGTHQLDLLFSNSDSGFSSTVFRDSCRISYLVLGA